MSALLSQVAINELKLAEEKLIEQLHAIRTLLYGRDYLNHLSIDALVGHSEQNSDESIEVPSYYASNLTQRSKVLFVIKSFPSITNKEIAQILMQYEPKVFTDYDKTLATVQAKTAELQNLGLIVSKNKSGQFKEFILSNVDTEFDSPF